MKLNEDELSRVNSALSEMKAKLETPKISQVLDKLFVLTKTLNENMNAQDIFDVVNKVLPNHIKNPATLGRCLSEHYGIQLISKRIGQKTYYNLELRERND